MTANAPPSALTAGKRDPERARCEPRDVEIGSGIRTADVFERRVKPAPLVVGERTVGRFADPLDVVGDAVVVVVVERRRVDPEHDVVHDDALRRVGALG